MARGSTTVVYKGYEEETGRVVLLKVLTRQAAQDPRLVNWFENEAEHVASIEHRNVVTLFRAGRDEDGRPFLVAEYVEGATLGDVLAQHGPLPPELGAFVGTQIAAGLAAAHAAGILHRDLNPSNVLIGSDGSVKLTDFGLATQVETLPNDVTLDVRGTPGYLAPEIVLGKEAGKPADLFALGATVAEAITGHKAFPSRTVQEALDSAIHHDPVSGLIGDPRVAPQLANTIASLLTHNPELRTTADEVIEELAKSAVLPATENEPVQPETLAAFLENPTEYEALRPPVEYRLADRHSVPNEDISSAVEQNSFWQRRGFRAASMFASFVLVALITAFVLSSQQSDPNTDALPVGTDRADSLGMEFPDEPSIAGTDGFVQDPATTENQLPTEVTSPETVPQSLNAQQADDATTATANPPDQTTVSEPEARTELAHGQLSVSVQPWAEVFIDGRKVGEGARIDVPELAVGRHQVSLRNPEFPNVSNTIEIREGERQNLSMSLWEYVARITLQVNPWASVKVDGRPIGDVPPERMVILRPGSHAVELTHPQLGTWTGTIQAAAGERRTMPFNLTRLLNPSGD